ncbi:hypothetical protein AeMF1_000378 [Aphanomyces euteiches]|nr:hypothetical protein AeMF1_000378 [Aphanomyces euteiches]
MAHRLLFLVALGSAAEATTPWRCVAHRSQYAPIRLNAAGDMECMANGQNCAWSATANACRDRLASVDNRAVSTLSCGIEHLAKFQATGYDKRNHWCSTSLAALDPSDPRVYQCIYSHRDGVFVGIHLNLNRHVECLSRDGVSCLARAATLDACMTKLISETVTSIPLVCTDEEYSKQDHWCNLIEKAPSTQVRPSMLRGNQVTQRPLTSWMVWTTTATSIGFLVALASFVMFLLCRQPPPKPEPRRYLLEKPKAPPGVNALLAFRIDHRDVHQTSLLGSGAHANVYLGQYKSIPVAIKRLRDSTSQKSIECFTREIQLLGSFHSPYVVQLIGVYWSNPNATDIASVTELMDGGDLRDFLATQKKVLFPWEDKLHWIQSIVDALVYLHSFPVVHRDLKSRNILLDSSKGVKLADFGRDERLVGSGRWMAPEVLQLNKYSPASDIFSFGVILFEFDSHQIPYTNIKDEWSGQALSDSAIMKMIVNDTIQLEFSMTMPCWLSDLGQQCLARNPSDRPTAIQMASAIRDKLRRNA